MLIARRRTLATLALVAVLAGAAAPANVATAKAKKIKVGGKVTITIPGFSPETGQSLASGRVKAKSGCTGLRVLRFAYFDATGAPTATTLTSVVTNPNGTYLVALPQPSGGTSPYVLRIAVEARKTTFRGKNVNCKAIFSPAFAVPAPPPSF